ncbi:uncharacterized protein EI90DRAFT_3291503 [Cantharellus anzutake]|uniref:uncharacterized protein n=1 Tax=Cantharellus anzutake TaxID=1750568 RepID=UPI0019061797|nr:uncharacterized protein EI90DRAFT_3291503 [Cantharellus anzutake]KAF8326022.1 hypothetical protein EI90DRAFT_3291503 [Cantharellus anzutake]
MSNDADALQRYVLDYEICAAAPVYRSYNPTARNSSRKAIEDALKRMDADYESIYEFSQKITTVERALRRRRTTLRNFLQPVAALPMEILQRIFRYAVQRKEDTYCKYLPSPITLSQVCSAWRHAAQSYPRIWTIVQMELCGHCSYAPYARYSRGLPLEIHERRRRDMHERMVGLKSADVRDRITALSLPLEREDDMDAAFCGDFWEMRGVSRESIERLTLFAPYTVDDPSAYGDALTKLSSLRHLFLENIFIPLSTTQLETLVTLTLYGVDVSCREFMDFIDACENIQELALDDVTLDEVMPGLQYFTLSFRCWWDKNDDIINDNWDISDVTSVGNLKPPVHLGMVKNFIVDTPTIKAITLEGGMKTLSYALKRLWPHSSPMELDNLPSLTDLAISVPRDRKQHLEGIVDIQLLIKARLEGRQAESRPLQKLTVPRFMFDDDVDWVRSRVRELELTD